MKLLEKVQLANACHLSEEQTNPIFNQMDTNHNGSVNKSELVTALKEFASS